MISYRERESICLLFLKSGLFIEKLKLNQLSRALKNIDFYFSFVHKLPSGHLIPFNSSV